MTESAIQLGDFVQILVEPDVAESANWRGRVVGIESERLVNGGSDVRVLVLLQRDHERCWFPLGVVCRIDPPTLTASRPIDIGAL